MPLFRLKILTSSLITGPCMCAVDAQNEQECRETVSHHHQRQQQKSCSPMN